MSTGLRYEPRTGSQQNLSLLDDILCFCFLVNLDLHFVLYVHSCVSPSLWQFLGGDMKARLACKGLLTG